jgi:endonuclease YncB( thermonuclease family)
MFWRVVLLLLGAGLAHAAELKPYYARVLSVIDGDTVIVEHGKRRITVRLAGIDAPERTQAWGDVARDALTGSVLRKEVRVLPQAVDDYGRTVGVLELAGRDINREQVRKGYAWEYSFHHSDHALVALQNEARAARRGLWSQPNPQAPWDYRKAQGGAAAAQSAPAVATAPGCGQKRYCSQMSNCEEARFYLVQCKVATLDRDGDGTPCESLCAPKPR